MFRIPISLGRKEITDEVWEVERISLWPLTPTSLNRFHSDSHLDPKVEVLVTNVVVTCVCDTSRMMLSLRRSRTRLYTTTQWYHKSFSSHLRVLRHLPRDCTQDTFLLFLLLWLYRGQKYVESIWSDTEMVAGDTPSIIINRVLSLSIFLERIHLCLLNPWLESV